MRLDQDSAWSVFCLGKNFANEVALGLAEANEVGTLGNEHGMFEWHVGRRVLDHPGELCSGANCAQDTGCGVARADGEAYPVGLCDDRKLGCRKWQGGRHAGMIEADAS